MVKKKIEILDIVVWAIAIFLVLVVLLPFMHIISLSLSGSDAIVKGKVGIFPVDFTLTSYIDMLKTPKILNSYKNSIIYTVSGTLLTLVLCTITAYPLSRKNLPGRGKIIGMIMVTMFFSGGTIPLFMLINNLRLMDTIWAIILPGAIPTFYMLLLKNYFENVPHELYEAAVADGASEFRILGQIFLPLAGPMLATLAVLTATGTWNAYMGPLMYISSPDKYPLQVVLGEMLIDEEVQTSTYAVQAALTPTGLKNVTVVLSVLPLLIAYPFLQKYFIGNVYAGSVKG